MGDVLVLGVISSIVMPRMNSTKQTANSVNHGRAMFDRIRWKRNVHLGDVAVKINLRTERVCLALKEVLDMLLLAQVALRWSEDERLDRA